MASLTRSQLFRLLGTGLRSRAALSRPTPVSRWSCIAAASSLTWSPEHSAASDLQVYRRQQLLQLRGYVGVSGGISEVLNVLEKMKAEEASGKGCGFWKSCSWHRFRYGVRTWLVYYSQ